MYYSKNNKLIIVHQVNCKGVMGAGFAKQVKDKYPQLYERYKIMCKSCNPKDLLGKIMVYEAEDKIIVSIFSQEDYGTDKCQTNYSAMEKGLHTLRKIYPKEIVIAPYKIGCGLAGGDWTIVSQLLKKYDIQTSTNIRL